MSQKDKLSSVNDMPNLKIRLLRQASKPSTPGRELGAIRIGGLGGLWYMPNRVGMDRGCISVRHDSVLRDLFVSLYEKR